MDASTIAVETLYQGLFSGEDPRWLLYNLRQRLRTECINTLDWASIVAYASVPWDFERQVHAFNDRQTRAKIDTLFDKAEKVYDNTENANANELKTIYQAIRLELEQWLNRLPEYAPKAERAEILGIYAASEKRIGIMHFCQGNQKRAIEVYQNACDYYQQALQTDPTNHWVITQYLSTRAVLVCDQENTGQLADELGDWWIAAKQIALWNKQNSDKEQTIWMLSTLSELELLSSVYSLEYKLTNAKKEIRRLCHDLVEVAGKNCD